MDEVLVSLEGGVLAIELNRPAKKNALNLAMYRALTQALAQASTDPEVRVVLWSGRGGSFCAGNDLADFADPAADLSPVLAFLSTLASTPVPVVAAVDGPAIGIGTTALLHCDLVLAAPGARFRLPFVDLGLVPEAASSLLLPGLIGQRRASAWLLLGETFGAEQAARDGLVNEVLAAEQLSPTARRWAERLAAKPPGALRESKALMKRWDAGAVRQAMDVEAEAFAARLRSPEALAAFAAFLRR
jgi:enoyl-CoA hydratase/carnithine racemase